MLGELSGKRIVAVWKRQIDTGLLHRPKCAAIPPPLLRRHLPRHREGLREWRRSLAEPKEEGPVKKEKSPCPKPEVRERATRVEEAPRRRSRSRRRKKEKEEKHREQKETRRTHRSPVPRVEPVRDSSHRSSPREKKHRRDPSPAEEEESEESPAVPSHSGLVRDSGRSVPRPPSHSPPPHRRAPRSPSRSPENRSKWKGPIRALPRRQEWERPQGRKHKKNKGLKKKARPREFKARGFWPKRR